MLLQVIIHVFFSNCSTFSMGLKWYSLVHSGLKCFAWSWTFYCSNSDQRNPVIQCNTSNLRYLYLSYFECILCISACSTFQVFHLCSCLLPFSTPTCLFASFHHLFCRLLFSQPIEFPWEGYVIAPPTSKGSRGRKAADWGNLALGRERPLILILNRHTSKWARGRGGGVVIKLDRSGQIYLFSSIDARNFY